MSPNQEGRWRSELGDARELYCVAVKGRPPRPVRDGLPAGEGRTVVLVPGFACDDWCTELLRRRLHALGYDAVPAAIGRNWRCGEEMMERLLGRLDSIAGGRGERVALVGHSRGGQLARVAAVRRPDLVGGVVTLGTPEDVATINPLIRALADSIALAGSAGVPGLLRRSCLDGACCERYRADGAAALPDGVALLQVWSRRDPIACWRVGDPPAGGIEVNATHAGLLLDEDAYRAVAESLPVFFARGPSVPPVAAGAG